MSGGASYRFLWDEPERLADGSQRILCEDDTPSGPVKYYCRTFPYYRDEDGEIVASGCFEPYESDAEDANDATDTTTDAADADNDVNEGGEGSADGNDNDTTDDTDDKDDELREGSEAAGTEEQPERPYGHSSSEASTQLELHADPVDKNDLAATKQEAHQPKATVPAKASRWTRFQAAARICRRREKH